MKSLTAHHSLCILINSLPFFSDSLYIDDQIELSIHHVSRFMQMHVFVISCTQDHLPVTMTIHTIRRTHVNNIIDSSKESLETSMQRSK